MTLPMATDRQTADADAAKILAMIADMPADRALATCVSAILCLVVSISRDAGVQDYLIATIADKLTSTFPNARNVLMHGKTLN